MFLILASLLVTQPVISDAFQKPLPIFGTPSRSVALVPTDAGVVGCWGEAPTGGGSHVAGARMSTAGRFDAPVVLEQAAPGRNDGAPAVGWNGSELLVAFEEDGFPNRVIITRLTRDLRPIDTPRVAMYAVDGGPAPAVAWNGREWLVTARHTATRFTRTLDVVAATTIEGPIQDPLAVGDTFALVTAPVITTSLKSPCPSVYIPLLGCGYEPPKWVTTGEWKGQLLPSNVSFTFPGTALQVAGTPSGAARPNDFFVVWPETGPTGRVGLNAAIVSRLGAPSAAGFYTVTELPGSGDDPHPQIAASATAALLVWEEQANIRGVFLRSDGRPDDEPFEISSTAAEEHLPAVLTLGDGNYLVAYEIDDRGLTQLATRMVITTLPRRPRAVR